MKNKQVAMFGNGIIKQLIPILNLDPNKIYQSIKIEVSHDDFVVIDVKTIPSKDAE
jgi:hypothetical protein